MKTINDLYDEAEEADIIIVEKNLKSDEAMSICDKGLCLIAIDGRKVKDSEDRKVKIAHELGHCQTGAFYDMSSMHQIKSKSEYKADKWAIRELIPEDKLLQAVSEGYTELWQLAEYFEVTEKFMKRALDIYKAMSVI